MEPSNPREATDWTVGPAKWAAVFVLTGVSTVGLVASLRGGTPEPASRTHVESRHSGAIPDSLATRGGEGARAAVPTADKPPPKPVAPEDVGNGATPISRINLNTATAAELELLPRIGPALAKRIIDYRDSRGPFRHVDDLDAIPGIGERTLDRLRPHVTVD